MTLKTRIIPCLDVKDGRVVKGVQFVDLVDAGDPVEAAIAYNAAGADELTFLDITASHENRDTIFDVVVLSTDLGIRKPDPAIFHHTLKRLGVAATSCLFADDTEVNLAAAQAMGITVIHALDEDETAVRLRALLGLPRSL